jgi:hypothetical protein
MPVEIESERREDRQGIHTSPIQIPSQHKFGIISVFEVRLHNTTEYSRGQVKRQILSSEAPLTPSTRLFESTPGAVTSDSLFLSTCGFGS